MHRWLGDKCDAHFALLVKAKEAPLTFEGQTFTYNATAQAPELSGVPEGCEDDVKLTYVARATHITRRIRRRWMPARIVRW